MIFEPIKRELEELEVRLKRILAVPKNDPLFEMVEYLTKLIEGKKLRPGLLFLIAKAFCATSSQSKSIDAESINAAVAIELFHAASLVHDDIIDKSKLRHNLPTAHIKCNEDIAIVLGDWLLALGFKSLSLCQNTQIRITVLKALDEICQGQLIQLLERNNFKLTKKQYYKIIKLKTAALFAASARVGALTNNVNVNELYSFGHDLGTAYQLIDDTLDLVGDRISMGKPVNQDIRAGEITLPLILLRESLSKDKLSNFYKLLESKDVSAEEELKNMLNNSAAITAAKKEIYQYLDCAKNSIDKLPQTFSKEGPMLFVEYLRQKANIL